MTRIPLICASGEAANARVRKTGRQKPEQKIVREVVDCKCGFESVTCPALSGSELRPGIQDEDVDLCAAQLLRKRLGKRPNI